MRDSKNILHAKLGVSPMERQYGGGLDAAYMNRRRSSAFADPDATSAFASPMSMGGLPTIYREQGGPLPITSVYGQGIPRIVYRENGGGLPVINKFYGGDVYSNEQLAEAEGISVDERGGFDPFQEPVTSQGGLWEPKPAKEINRELMQKEKEEKANRSAINQLYHMQRYGRVGQRQDDRGLRTGPTAPIDNRSYNFDFPPAFPAASNPPSTPIKDSSPPIDENLLDEKLGDLSRPDFNRIWDSLQNKMTGIQSNKFSRGTVSLDNTVREAQAAAKEILDGPMSTRKTGGGLPTIYRQDGGGMDDDYAESELSDIGGSGISIEGVSFEDPYGPTGEDDWTTAKAQAQLGAMRGPSKTMQELEEDKELGYSPVELANIYQSQGDKKNASRVINESILSNTARNALLSALYGKVGGQGGFDGVEDFIANMSPEALANFNAAASGSSLLGDIKGDDPSKGYRFGGPEGTLEDIFEKSVMGAEEGLQKLLKDEKKEEEKKKEKSVDKGSTLGSLLNYLEKGISKLTGGKSLTPETIESMQSFAKSQGDEFIPTSVADSTIGKVLSFSLPGPLGMLPKPIGVYRTKNGLEFDVAADRSLSLRTPTPNIDYGNEVSTTSDKPEKKKKEIKEEEEKKNYMKDYFSGLQSLDNTGDLKNFYERKSLEYIYPNKTSAEINAMINKP